MYIDTNEPLYKNVLFKDLLFLFYIVTYEGSSY